MTWPPCLVAEGAMGSMACGPASLLGLADSHRPITQSKNRVAFVEMRGKVILATACVASWLRFLADGGTCLPCEPVASSSPPWRLRTLGSDGPAPRPFQLRLESVPGLCHPAARYVYPKAFVLCLNPGGSGHNFFTAPGWPLCPIRARDCEGTSCCVNGSTHA